MGVLQQKRRWIRCGRLGRGCVFLARWMAHGALAVMQHNAAVSQSPSVLLGDGAWHSHSAPAAPARPHPGPWQPLAGSGSCFYLVGLSGAGHLGIRVAAFALGVTSPAPPVGCGDQGTPCSSDAGRSCWPAYAEGSPMHGREGLQNDNPGCGAFGVFLPTSMHLP